MRAKIPAWGFRIFAAVLIIALIPAADGANGTIIHKTDIIPVVQTTQAVHPLGPGTPLPTQVPHYDPVTTQVPHNVTSIPLPHYTFEINSNPAGAELTIDSKDWGITPVTVTIETGAHHIKLRKAGYQDFIATVTFSSQTAQMYTLAPSGVVTTAPPVVIPTPTQAPHTTVILPVTVVVLALVIAVLAMVHRNV
jgi:hypothetical protein